jgi:Tfp pilus assembly protein PilP
MKAKTTIAILVLSAVALYAQQAPSTAGKAGAAVQKQAQTAAKPAENPKAEAAKAETKAEAKPEAIDNDRVRTVGKRDPFVSPIVNVKQSAIQMATSCGSGKRCLIIDQISLQGVVKSANGNIAVVVNSAKRAYFLRENDGLFNGRVQRITPDSVLFIENVVDRMGRASTREVVKRVNPGPA